MVIQLLLLLLLSKKRELKRFRMKLCKCFLSIPPVPDHPPPNVTAFNTSSTSINVTWEHIPPDHVNGILLGYYVKYLRHDKANANITMVTVNSTTLHVELEGLGKYKEYSIQVAGSTVVGLGNFSEPVYVRTEQDGTYCSYK